MIVRDQTNSLEKAKKAYYFGGTPYFVFMSRSRSLHIASSAAMAVALGAET